jgi:hypothetical protein
MLDTINTELGSTAELRIYDGTIPTDPDTALGAQVLLAQLVCSSTVFGAASAGVITASAIASDTSANATGTASWASFVTGAGVRKIDCSVGTRAPTSSSTRWRSRVAPRCRAAPRRSPSRCRAPDMARQNFATVLADPPIISAGLTPVTATSETILWNVSQYTPIAANDATAGKIYQVTAGGVMSFAATGALTITPRFGLTVAAGSRWAPRSWRSPRRVPPRPTRG